MQRLVLPALLLVLLAGSVGRAEDWARKMFGETSHDFGTVVHGAKVEYRFQFNNPYKETAHVVGVRSSCGCTSPEIVKNELKTFEKSEVIATFNTKAFTGHHSATLTVTFDKPFYAEVQLNVYGDIRGDVNVQPSQVELGTIAQGQPVERKITVTRNGHSDWQILDVRSLNTSYEVEVVDGPRGGGQVSYDLIVRLKKDAKPGYLHDQLILVTNDPNLKQFPIEVEGVVKAELNVSPQAIAFGSVETGQKVTKPVIVTGHKPFKIVSVHCDDDSFSFKVPEASAKVQIIPVTLTPDKPGMLAKKIKIETDLGGHLAVEVLAQAQVKQGPPAPSEDSPKPGPSDAATQDLKSGEKAVGDKPLDNKPKDTESTSKSNSDKPSSDKPGSKKQNADNSDGPSLGDNVINDSNAPVIGDANLGNQLRVTGTADGKSGATVTDAPPRIARKNPIRPASVAPAPIEIAPAEDAPAAIGPVIIVPTDVVPVQAQ